MECKNCGNKLDGDEKFCGKCGAKISNEISEEISENMTNNGKRVIKIKMIYLFIGIIAIILLPIFIIFMKNSNIMNKKVLSTKELTNILKQSENGIYLKEDSVKIGTASKINYKNYNYLITYSSVLANNGVTLKAGAVLLYDTKTKDSKILTFQADLTSVIYYLNTEKATGKLKSVTDTIADYIEKYGEEAICNTTKTSEKYIELGKAIGKIVGVKLCRNIVRNYMVDLNPNLSSTIFLYNKDEITVKYAGMNTTVKQYNWSGIIDETSARLIAANNYSSYRNIVALYGEPYSNVTKFVVYQFVDGDAKEVKKYDNVQKAKDDLKVEE